MARPREAQASCGRHRRHQLDVVAPGGHKGARRAPGHVGATLAPDFSDALTPLSENEILIALEAAHAMPRMGKRPKLRLLARTYGEAGLLLRLVQRRR